MRLVFHGAAGRVTGSCHLLEAGGRRILLDCGLIQGSREEEALNRAPFPFEPADIDAVVLSHAHIDHSGRLPLLYKAGFRGPVYAQAATADLCRIMLKDSGFLQEKDAETENRKRARKGLAPVDPLYTVADAVAAMRRFRRLPYDEKRTILPGIEIRFRDAGHILGSSIVEAWLAEGELRRKVVFSGDLGQPATPILRDPTPVREADVVLLESTYGDRLHRSRERTLEELAGIFAEALSGKGNILIPAFAVGRTQEILYLFGQHAGEWALDRWQVCLDSPMAIDATAVYAKHAALFDDEAARLWREGGAAALGGVRICRTSEQSRALNRIRSGAIIIAGSGMCEGGRIRHHLKNNAWRKECHIVIVGYQARGTTGRRLVDGAPSIRLWGEEIRVAAKVHTVGGLSAHADQAGLAQWYGAFASRPPVCLVHGEEDAQVALEAILRERYGAKVTRAAEGMAIDLARLGRAA